MAEMTLQQAFELASNEHRAGRLDNARKILEQIIGYQPTHVEALLSLGQLNVQLGRPDYAIEFLRRAAAIAPDRADIVANLGMLQAVANRPDEALPMLRRALQLNPQLVEVHNNIGNIFRSKGDFAAAIAEYRQAVERSPNYADALVNLGVSLLAVHETLEAIAVLQRAVAVSPGHVDAQLNLGEALRREGRYAEAIPLLDAALAARPTAPEIPMMLGQALTGVGDTRRAIDAYQRAIALNPNNADAFSYLGVAYTFAGDLDAAFRAAQRAVELKPDSGEVQNNWGHILQKLGRVDEAVVAYREALRLSPEYPEPQNNIASTLWDSGRFEEGLAEMRKASALNPGHAAIDANLGMMMLTLGDFENGWRVYEARNLMIPVALDQQADKPRWDGSNPSGKTIIVESEQGFGDSIEFARYVPMLASRGARVIVRCEPALQRLMQTLDGVAEVITPAAPLPAFDSYTRMLSLPALFKTELEHVPANVPYLRPDPARVEAFRQQLASDAGFKIGISWAGNPAHGNDRERTIPMQMLAPLAQVPGARFYSLQKAHGAEQAQLPLGDQVVTDWTPQLNDFADTAALIVNLDLVISVDSAVAHLGGALAAKTWVLVNFVPDWRWMLSRSDSPWYPTVRLFRQSIKGSWVEPINEMAAILREMVAAKS